MAYNGFVRIIVNASSYGFVGNSAITDTAAVQAAVNAANSLGGTAFIPKSCTLNNITGIKNLEADYGTIITPGKTDGSYVFTWTDNTQEFSVRNVRILGSFSISGGGVLTTQNVKGFSFGTPPSSFATRFTIENCTAQGLAQGFNLESFIVSAYNIKAESCTLGFQGNQLNASWINLHCENCSQALVITNSSGLVLDGFIDEGGLSNQTSSTIDGGATQGGITMVGPYWEQATFNRTVPYLIVGGTSIVRSFIIEGMSANGINGDVPLLKIDRVDGGYVRGNQSAASLSNVVLRTANTINFHVYYANPGGNVSGNWNHDETNSEGSVFNYFPNPNFDCWFRGWAQVQAANCVISQETTLVRKGPNAVRITASSSSDFNVARFIVKGSSLTALQGKQIIMWAWVWVPAIAEFPNNPLTRTLNPGITISSFNGSSTVNSTGAIQIGYAGTWNLMWATVAMQADATEFLAQVFVNDSSNNADGNEYVVVDSIYVTDANVPIEKMLLTTPRDSDSISASCSGGLVQFYGTSAPADTAQTYVLGDRIWLTNPSAGSSPGSVCTTAGAGGTAVFKAMASLSA